MMASPFLNHELYRSTTLKVACVADWLPTIAGLVVMLTMNSCHTPLIGLKVTDWLPTIAGLVGADTSRNFALDGHDMLPSIVSNGATASPRTEMLYGVNPLVDGEESLGF